MFEDAPLPYEPEPEADASWPWHQERGTIYESFRARRARRQNSDHTAIPLKLLVSQPVIGEHKELRTVEARTSLASGSRWRRRR